MAAPPPGTTVRHLTDDDVGAAATVFRGSLGLSVDPQEDAVRYRRYWDVERSLGAFDAAGRLLGVAATFPSRMTVEGGAALACAAVPSVGVRADSQGHGVGRALLERQVDEARERGVAMLALNASEVAIYGRYGYGPTSRWLGVEVDPRRVRWREDAPRAAPGSVTELDSAEEVRELLPPLHQRALGRWAGELERTEGHWWMALHPRGSDAPWSTAVHRGADGEVDAAVRFTTTLHTDDTGFANRVEVHDSIGTDPGAEATLWRWLLDRHLVGSLSAERMNPRLPLAWMLADPRVLRVRWDADAVWTRVLDLPRVLGARTTWGTGRVVVEVLDPLFDATRGRWSVAGEDGRLLVEPTGDEPAVILGIDLLAPLAWGHVRARSLVEAGRVRAVDASAVDLLDGLLATDGPAWCSTGF